MVQKETKEANELNDLGTFELVFNKYYKPLVIYANTFIKDIPESQDIVQQVFVSVWEKRDGIHVHTSLSSLLYKSVYNASLNRIKQLKVRSDHAKEVQLNTASPVLHESIQEKELQAKINSSIDSLPEQCAKIFKMSRFDHLKYQEIADELGLSVKTVENQMGKALKLMRESLKDYMTILIILQILF